MKRVMLGTVEVDTENYWTAGKNSQELRCNETVIYAEIDDRQSDAKIAKNQSEVQRAYNEMDMFWLILQAINKYALDANLLRKAGVVIGNMVLEGKFSLSFASLTDENAYIVRLCAEMETRTENFGETGENSNFMQYYKENVLDLNYYNNTDGTKTVDKPHLDGLGASSTSDEWSAKMKEAGTYLLYHVAEANKQEGMDKKAVARKMAEQERMLTWLHNSSNNMTRNSILANARSGIKEKTGMQPKDALITMGKQAKGVSGLGELVAIVLIIVAAVALIMKIVSAIVAARYQAQVNKAYAEALNDDAPSESGLNAAAPSNSDFTDMFLKLLSEDEEEETSLMMKDENGEDLPLWRQPIVWIAGVLVAGIAGLGIASAMKKKKKSNGQV